MQFPVTEFVRAILLCSVLRCTHSVLPPPLPVGGGGGGGLGGNKREEKRLEQRTAQHFIHQDSDERIVRMEVLNNLHTGCNSRSCSAYSRAPVLVENFFVTADTGILLLLMLDCLTTIKVKKIQKASCTFIIRVQFGRSII